MKIGGRGGTNKKKKFFFYNILEESCSLNTMNLENGTFSVAYHNIQCSHTKVIQQYQHHLKIKL